MNNLDISSAIQSYKHAVLAYLNFGHWSKIVPVAQKAVKSPQVDVMRNTITAGLLAVDYFMVKAIHSREGDALDSRAVG
ncbi:hypothetical protein FOZ60_000498 [Perkinsus olseni]|uniref:Uncharacterized protein n=1 Tax=Perkinsus olseni TaxID=32597 RepID=A0A7J6P2A3_PEROL|nr:hypothetical protein FOZ60_000498 [Perkinsus olseni]